MTSPPTKCASLTDLSTNSDNRKRKLLDYNMSHISDDISQAIESKFSSWQAEIHANITSAVNFAVTSAIGNELSKFTLALGEIKNDMAKLGEDNNNINRSLSTVNAHLVEMEKSLDFNSTRQDTLEGKVQAIEKVITSTQGQAERVLALERTIASMEQQARTNNIEICNLPEKRGENLVQIFMNICSAIKFTITASDIISVHRVPQADPTNKRPKNIIVRLPSCMLRDNILAAFRVSKGLDTSQISLGGHKNNIYLNEHLTLKNKHLFRQCREAARKCEYKYVWVRHATILLRKNDTSPVLAVRCNEDLGKLAPK
jgi:hypothetical protein